MLVFSVLFIFIFKNVHVIFNDVLSFNWYSCFWRYFIVVLLYLYISYSLIEVKNFYQLIGYSTFFIFILAIILFIYQYDVFASILLVSEFVIMLFSLFNVINLNVTNTKYSKLYNNYNLLLISYLFCLIGFNTLKSNYFIFFLNWYKSINFNYNDFTQLYVYMYTYNIYMLYIIGLFLLMLTIYLLFVYFNTFNKDKFYHVDFVKKNQSIWYQLSNIPFVKYYNDFKRK